MPVKHEKLKASQAILMSHESRVTGYIALVREKAKTPEAKERAQKTIRCLRLDEPFALIHDEWWQQIYARRREMR